MFIKRGVKINVLSEEGDTPLDIALQYNNLANAQILYNAGGRASSQKDKLYLLKR